jgi:hypothetical protein
LLGGTGLESCTGTYVAVDIERVVHLAGATNSTNFPLVTPLVSNPYQLALDLETPETEALKEEPRGGHADEIETSIHLFPQPNLLRMEKAVKDLGRPTDAEAPGYRPGLYSRDRRDPDFSETGLTGDPTRATAESPHASHEGTENQGFTESQGAASYLGQAQVLGQLAPGPVVGRNAREVALERCLRPAAAHDPPDEWLATLRAGF